MRTRICIALVMTLALTAQAQAPKPTSAGVLTLTPGDVTRLVLTQSDQLVEINAVAGEAELPYHLVLGAYDFNLQFNGGYTVSRFLNTNFPTYASETRTWGTQAILQKPFTTGTTVGLELDRNWANTDLLPNAPTTLFQHYTQNILGITITQNLWRNFFGRGDRAQVESAAKTIDAARIGRLVDLQNLVLNAMQAYWKAYVAQQTFQSALNSRDRYQKLVQAVRRKSTYGYTNAGELPQVEAEFETQAQTVKTSSADYLAAVDALITLLKLPPGTELRFKAVEELPPPPTAAPLDPAKLRAIKAEQLRKEAADQALVAAKSINAADVSLVGKAYTSGDDPSASEADRQLTSGNYPQYYVGLRYQYSFGSGLLSEQIRNKKLAADAEASHFERTKRETSDQLINLERQVQAYYNVAMSSRTQKQLREKAVNELNRTYTQGRTDIAILIEAMNNYFTSEINVVQSLGNYQVALNQLAALRDELIPDTSAASPAADPVLPGNHTGVTAPGPTSPPTTD